MTNEEINKAIAEYCGWKYEFNGNDEDPEWYWIAPNNPDGNETSPDYCNNLNAMAEAENTLNDDQQYEYAYVLDGLIENRSCEFNLIHASARMRAEAFVRTIGKLKE
jgi:hypothetical protein